MTSVRHGRALVVYGFTAQCLVDAGIVTPVEEDPNAVTRIRVSSVTSVIGRDRSG